MKKRSVFEGVPRMTRFAEGRELTRIAPGYDTGSDIVNAALRRLDKALLELFEQIEEMTQGITEACKALDKLETRVGILEAKVSSVGKATKKKGG